MPTMFETATVQGMGLTVRLPALELRSTGLFTQVVPQVDLVGSDGVDRTGMGAAWITRDALGVTVAGIDDPCDIDSEITLDQIDLSQESTMPFAFNQTLSCSTIGGLGMPEINAMLDSDFEAVRSEALMRGLTTVISADHLNFVAATSVGSGAILVALGLIEDGLGDRISNLRGHIFIPLTLLPAAVGSGAVKMVNGELVSPAGHKVISDAGHDSQTTLYATGAIAWALQAATSVREKLDRNMNVLTGLRQHYAVVAFNPEHTIRATVS